MNPHTRQGTEDISLSVGKLTITYLYTPGYPTTSTNEEVTSHYDIESAVIDGVDILTVIENLCGLGAVFADISDAITEQLERPRVTSSIQRRTP